MKQYLKTAFSETFYRVDDQNSHYNSLDGIRAISVLLVAVFHICGMSLVYIYGFDVILEKIKAAPYLLGALTGGQYGVDIFFALSGFLISVQLINEHESTNLLNKRRFYLKRILRIYPLYLCFLIPALFFQLPGALNSLLSIDTLFGLKAALPVIWSISIELHFYLIAPFLVAWLYRSAYPLVTLSLLAFVLLLIRLIIINNEIPYNELTLGDFITSPDRGDLANSGYYLYIYASTVTRIVTFLPGVFAAWIFVYHKEKIHRMFEGKLFSILAPLTILCLLMYFWTYNFLKLTPEFGFFLEKEWHFLLFVCTRFFIAALVSAIILMTCVEISATKWLRLFLSHKVFYPISRLSYAIYLIHLYCMGLAGFLIIKINPAFKSPDLTGRYDLIFLFTTGSIFISCVFAFFIYCFIERPFMVGRLRKRVFKYFNV